MAEFPENVRRPGGSLEPRRGPYGPRVLLPTEVELCNTLGITDKDYFQFIELASQYAGERGKEYAGIPDIRADLSLTTMKAGELALTTLGKVVFGVALLAASMLLAPKPGKPGPQLRTEDQSGTRRYAPRTAFDSIQELALLGDLIPLVYTKQETTSGGFYGGVRVDSTLLWSQLLSLGASQQLKVLALFSHGELKELPGFDGFAIGGLSLKDYANAKIAIYGSTGSSSSDNRFTEGSDKYSEGKLLTGYEPSDDPFEIRWLEATVTTQPYFSGTRNPQTQATFGLYAPMPNAMPFRLPYELINPDIAMDDHQYGDLVVKIMKIGRHGGDPPYDNTARWPTRCAVTSYNSTSKEFTYELDDSIEIPIAMRPHGVSDVNSVINTIREEADSNLSAGETYMIGPHQVVCIEESSPNHIWKPGRYVNQTFNTQNNLVEGVWQAGIPKTYTFSLEEEDTIQPLAEGVFDGAGDRYTFSQTMDFPRWYWQGKSNPGGGLPTGQIFSPENIRYWQNQGSMYDGSDLEGTNHLQLNVTPIDPKGVLGEITTTTTHSTPCVQRLAIGTITNNRKCDQTEIGIRSTVWKQISFTNVNSRPDPATLKYYREKKGSITLGRVDKHIRRLSFFKLEIRKRGESAWTRLKGSESNHSGLFCIRGNNPQPQYNFITINHPRGQYEYRLVPFPGNVFKSTYLQDEEKYKKVYLLHSSDIRGSFQAGDFTVAFSGNKNYVVNYWEASNPEWLLGVAAGTGIAGGSVLELESYENIENASGYSWVEEGNDYATSSPPKFVHRRNEGTDQYAWGFYWGLMDWVGGNGGVFHLGTIITPRSVDFNQVRLVWYGDTDSSFKPKTFQSQTATEAYYSIQQYRRTSTNSEVQFDQEYSPSGGSGSGLKLQLKVWESLGGGEASASWSVSSTGSGYKAGDIVTVPSNPGGGSALSGFSGLTIKISQVLESPLDEASINLNPWDAIQDYPLFEGERSSHQEGPEHEISYVNEQIEVSNGAKYQDLAYTGLILNSAKEWTNFSQFSAYFKEGIKVLDLTSTNNSKDSTNLFPNIAYDLLTSTKYGVGAQIGSASVDDVTMKKAAEFCKANKYYWDGILSEKINLRQWIHLMAGYYFLDFTIIGGKFSLTPAVPYTNSFVIDKGAIIQPIAMFTDGNIRNLNVTFLEPEQKQLFIAECLWRAEESNGFSETRSFTVQLREGRSQTEMDSDPIETFDMSGFCTNPQHAEDFARYAIKTRQLVDHSVKFQTTPQNCEGIEPGSYIRLISEATHTSRWENGSIDDNGYVTSAMDISTTINIFYWKPGTQSIQTETLAVSNGRTTNATLFGTLFTREDSSTTDRVYKVESLSYGEEGFIEIAASYVPLTDSGSLAVLDWGGASLTSSSHFKYTGNTTIGTS